MPTKKVIDSPDKLKENSFPLANEVRDYLREEIEEANGAEILSVVRVQENGNWAELRILARGNEEAAPAVLRGLRPGEILLHNHPNGNLSPSDADLSVAHTCGNSGIGFAIHNNGCNKCYVVVEPFQAKERVALDFDSLAQFLLPEGALARNLPDFEPREGQIGLMNKVVEALNTSSHAILEGETGVGKSLGYLLPSVFFALENKCRVVVSTNTINLQMQLVNKDLPLLKRGAGKDFSFQLVKGRRNYLCLRRMQDLESSHEGEYLLEKTELDEYDRLKGWMKKTEDGSLADLSWIPSGDFWDKVNSDKDTCLGVRCDKFRNCFFYVSRRRTAEADILVVNHHLLFTDLAIRAEMKDFSQTVILPGFEAVILDEAHNLEDVATSHFGVRTTGFGLTKLLGRLYRQSGRKKFGILSLLSFRLIERGSALPKAKVSQIQEEIMEKAIPFRQEVGDTGHMFFERIGEMILEATPSFAKDEKDGEYKRRIDDGLMKTDAYLKVAEEGLKFADLLQIFYRILFRIHARMTDALKDLDEEQKTYEVPLHELKSMGNRIKEIRNALLLVFNPETPQRDEYVHFFSVLVRGRQRYNAFHSAPIDVGRPMREFCFQKISTVVLVSGTLSTQNHFSFIKNRLGMDSSDFVVPPLEGRFVSPFDYSKQARLFIPTDVPEPSHPEFVDAIAEAVFQISLSSRGGCLVLCTSYFHLRKLHELLNKPLSEVGLVSFRQGDEERTRLLEKFREDGNAVLFATESFWEGIDVPGQALRNLIITKLPFAVPDDPILQARQERMKKPFFEYQIPKAIIRLKQGFGRLIRNKKDRGVIWILDRRLITKFYGRFFLESLPPVKKLKGPFEEIIGPARTFFRSGK